MSSILSYFETEGDLFTVNQSREGYSFAMEFMVPARILFAARAGLSMLTL
jgi:hypothetical protein